MYPRTLRWIAVTAAAVAAVLCWYLLTREPDATPRTAGKAPAAAAVTGRGIPPPPAQWPEIGTPQFKHLARDRALPWLDARGRDPAGLVAMWDLTGDESFLTEAADRFPHDPIVCIAMIGKEANTASKALPWIERFLATQPHNPHAWHLKAWALLESDLGGALIALQQAVTEGGPRESMVSVRAWTVREAALAAGMSAGNAARLAIDAPLDRTTSCRVTDGICRTIIAEFDQAKAAADHDRLKQIAHLALVTALSITGGGPVTFRDERMINRRALILLSDLPDDAELDPAGPSVGALKSDLESRLASLEKAGASYIATLERLRTASDDILVYYAETLLTLGEHTAVSVLPAEPTP